MAFKITHNVREAQKRTRLLNKVKMATKVWKKTCEIASKEYTKETKAYRIKHDKACEIANLKYAQEVAPTRIAWDDKRKIAQEKYNKAVEKSSKALIRAQRALNRASSY